MNNGGEKEAEADEQWDPCIQGQLVKISNDWKRWRARWVLVFEESPSGEKNGFDGHEPNNGGEGPYDICYIPCAGTRHCHPVELGQHRVDSQINIGLAKLRHRNGPRR